MSEVKFNTQDLKGYSLFVATPMYGGQCTSMYTKSLIDLTVSCAIWGIPLKFHFLTNESLITRARNYAAEEFLDSECTHCMFIDADIGFDHLDVLRLLWIQTKMKNGIIGAVYPKKNISWEKIKHAAPLLNDPNDLAKVQSDFVLNLVPGTETFKSDEVVEALEIGTGFMMIPRETFLVYKERFPEYNYLPDHGRSDKFNGSREITMFFQADIDPTSKRYLSEDYWFCQKVRELGMKVHFCPWMSENLKHVGNYVFAGSLAAMAAVNVSPTVDIETVKSNIEKSKS